MVAFVERPVIVPSKCLIACQICGLVYIDARLASGPTHQARIRNHGNEAIYKPDMDLCLRGGGGV